MLPSLAMESEASHMLEAALEQMDDIIAGSKVAAAEFSNGLYDLSSPISTGPLQVVQLAEDLKLALDLQLNQQDRASLRTQLPAETAQALLDWLQGDNVNLCSPANNETYQERLLRLEGDKESLVLQVSILTDQVETQGEKIKDLESSLEVHNQKLVSTEEMLQQELLNRTSLETQKLDLVDEVSYLKLKLVSMEETEADPQTNACDSTDNEQNKAQCVVNLISELQEQMCRFQEEISSRIQEKQALEQREAQQWGPRSEPAQPLGSEAGLDGSGLCRSAPCSPGECCIHDGRSVHELVEEVKQLKSKVEELEGEKVNYERKLRTTKSLMTQLSSLKLTVEHTQLEKQRWEERWRRAQAEITELQQLLATKDAEIQSLQDQLLARDTIANDHTGKDQEFQKLKRGMETLLASNDEKDRHIEELTALLGQYRKMKEIMQGSSEEDLSGSLKLRALTHKAHSDILRSEFSSRGSSPLLMSSTPYQRSLDFSSRNIHNSMETYKVSICDASFLNGSWGQGRLLSSSLEELQSGSSQKAVEFQTLEPETSDTVAEHRHMELNKYQTLPGKLNRDGDLKAELNGGPEGERDRDCSPPGSLFPDQSLHKDYTPIRYRSASAPALGHSECLDESVLSDQSPLSSGVDSGQQSPVSPEHRKSHRGIKKLWGKIRRSQSGSPVQVDDPELGEFRRGGFRATAGPRLARAGNTRDLKTPFSKWTSEQVCDWLEEIGLGQYGILARHWVTSGQTLVSASSQELEKEMGLKNPLHRKKLQLAVKTFNSKHSNKSASTELDHIWVTRWLDDIGLPQYKDQFSEGRVDGQMLQYLTVKDLLFLKVSSQLHHLSIKCAIHVLHVNKFHPGCLKRRPSTENQASPTEVVQWSNHRVMEWLRSVDLAEYAPNLRGSGVHGGLIILEPRFNSDTLAMLLNIPPQKTLLRRHLATNFSSLVGTQAEREKREYTEVVGYSPLSTTAKVRPKKLGFSHLTHLRRRRPDDSTNYICPLESSPSPSPPQGSSSFSSSSSPAQPAINGTQMRAPYAGFRGLSPILDREPGCSREQVGLDDS